MVQNTTIEERVSLLELQVTNLDEDVDFLFDEQVIQDERLLELEQTSDGVVVELAEINGNIQGELCWFQARFFAFVMKIKKSRFYHLNVTI